MENTDIIKSLSAAKEAHLVWLDYGLAILKGEDLLHVQQPESCTDCKFGQWYYAEIDSLRSIEGFKEIELLHAEFHHQYDILYTHAHDAHKPRLFGKRKRLKMLEQDYLALEQQSNRLMKKLSEVEKKLGLLMNMPSVA